MSIDINDCAAIYRIIRANVGDSSRNILKLIKQELPHLTDEKISEIILEFI